MRLGLPFLRVPRRSSLIPVLTYHSLHTPGDDYDSNDHIALEEDLRIVRKMGFQVAQLTEIARFARGSASRLETGSWVGLSFDDGSDWDYYDFAADGRSFKGFLNILKGATDRDKGFQPRAVSFVIASPQARKVLDRVCIAGNDNWRDSWWNDAARGGTLSIGNHSWDHTHLALESVAQRNQQKGTFLGIDNRCDADIQIGQAELYIDRKTDGSTARLFAYPYGEASEYLVREYFPKFQEHHRQHGAFTTDGDYVSPDCNRWSLPRFVCGHHWRTPGELEKILAAARSR